MYNSTTKFWPSTINSTIVVCNVIDKKKCRWSKFRRTVVRYSYGRNLNGLAYSCDWILIYVLTLHNKNERDIYILHINYLFHYINLIFTYFKLSIYFILSLWNLHTYFILSILIHQFHFIKTQWNVYTLLMIPHFPILWILLSKNLYNWK